jgi:hypothetical protein
MALAVVTSRGRRIRNGGMVGAVGKILRCGGKQWHRPICSANSLCDKRLSDWGAKIFNLTTHLVPAIE